MVCACERVSVHSACAKTVTAFKSGAPTSHTKGPLDRLLALLALEPTSLT